MQRSQAVGQLQQKRPGEFVRLIILKIGLQSPWLIVLDMAVIEPLRHQRHHNASRPDIQSLGMDRNRDVLGPSIDHPRNPALQKSGIRRHAFEYFDGAKSAVFTTGLVDHTGRTLADLGKNRMSFDFRRFHRF